MRDFARRRCPSSVAMDFDGLLHLDYIALQSLLDMLPQQILVGVAQTKETDRSAVGERALLPVTWVAVENFSLCVNMMTIHGKSKRMDRADGQWKCQTDEHAANRKPKQTKVRQKHDLTHLNVARFDPIFATPIATLQINPNAKLFPQLLLLR